MLRFAASLILAVRHEPKYNNTILHNYNLLCLKRNKKMDFYPEAYVFPGGNLDPADSDLKWYDFFANFGFNGNSFASLKPKSARPQQLIFQSQQNEIAREVSLRITAIRETFEESGVLLCRRTKDRQAAASWAQNISLPRDELHEWRKKVHKNAAKFFEMCEKYECYPDLWALHEWSNWVTPVHLPKRFDTIFFLACMPFMPHAEYDAVEMMDLKWETPKYFLSISETLAPPQMYEFTMLKAIKGIDELLDFAVQRDKAGGPLILPVRVDLKDISLYLYPGDSMYPDEGYLNIEAIDKSDITADEFQQMTAVKNRLEWRDERKILIQSENVQTRDIDIKHIATDDGEIKSKF